MPTGYAKGFAQLATAPAKTILHVPLDQTQWKTDTLDISSFTGQKLLVRFISVSRFGNALYLDNIRTDRIVGVDNTMASKRLNLYPNPAETAIYIQRPESITTDAGFKIYSMDGRIVRVGTLSASLNEEFELEIGDLPAGIFTVLLADKDQIWHSRFSKK